MAPPPTATTPKTQATDQLKPPPINPSTTTATAPKTHQQPLPCNPSTTTATTPQPINNHNHSHDTTNPSHRSTQATDQPINNHSHDTKNPSAHAADSKPTGANPLKKIITDHSKKKEKTTTTAPQPINSHRTAGLQPTGKTEPL